MRLWASIRMSRPRLPFATFGFYVPRERHPVTAAPVEVAGTLRTGGYDGFEDEKPHRSGCGQHPDPHADCPAPGDSQREGSGPVPADLDWFLRGPGDSDQDLR